MGRLHGEGGDDGESGKWGDAPFTFCQRRLQGRTSQKRC